MMLVRRRWLRSMSFIFAMTALPAFAQDEFTQPEDEPEITYESPQYFAIEIKFGPYSPDVDAEFDGRATPFKDVFGSGTRVSFGGEFDYQFWHGFGNIGVGVGAGWYYASTKPFADNGNDTTPATPGDANRVAGKTSLRLIPVSLLLIYRFDVIAERWNIPIVPYVKVGGNYTFWKIGQSDGSTATYQNTNGSGGTWGWQVNAGGALRLDFLESSAAKKLDVSAGINHSYLFCEFVHIQADNFGASDALSVGDTTFFGGLAFEF